jgi:tRNA_anti-like
MKRKWLFLLIILLLLALVGYKYIYQEHRDIKNEHAEFVVSSITISNEFSQNSTKAEKKYLNKTIEINGVISEINENNLTLNNSVFCQFKNTINSTKYIEDTITIKGRCIGYDDLLEIVKIDQSTIIE